jgi:serine/threonine-protein kinase
VLGLDLDGRTVGGYHVGRLLGRGAYGWVFQARQVSLDRDVALKVLDPMVARSPEAAERFDREGRSAARLDHPAIVDVYQAGEADGLHFLAMRLIRGPGLDDVLRRHGRLAPGPALTVLRRIADALDHAHARGVVHRDVKPSNILLEGADPARSWLGDFGIAVTIRVAGALSTAAVGTAAYMAPEQVDPTRIGPAADQYALACVGYELLTGRPPFSGDDLVAMLLAHANNPVPGTGSAALDAVFARALAKDPTHRYPTVSQFVAALDHAAAQIPDHPAPRRKRRWWIPTTAVVAAAIIAGLLVWLWPSSDAPSGWQAVRGPDQVSYDVPAGWQRSDQAGLSLVSYTNSGAPVLYVGDQQESTVDPTADARQQYGCAGVTATRVAGRTAAACATGSGEAVVVADGSTLVRFVFAGAVPSGDRDAVLASVRFTG